MGYPFQPKRVTRLDTFQALKVAAAVQRAGSFSAAARQIGVSPAAVAKLVAQLESRLGLRLFDRTTHDLSVTGEGRDLLARLAVPLREVDDALASGRNAKLVGVHHVAQAIVDGRLVRVLKDLHGPRFQIVIYFAKRRLLPQRTRAFVDPVRATAPACEALRACQRAMAEPGA
jgi:DNA-binding transcriptional LysR family regulator